MEKIGEVPLTEGASKPCRLNKILNYLCVALNQEVMDRVEMEGIETWVLVSNLREKKGASRLSRGCDDTRRDKRRFQIVFLSFY